MTIQYCTLLTTYWYFGIFRQEELMKLGTKLKYSTLMIFLVSIVTVTTFLEEKKRLQIKSNMMMTILLK
jgi:hypothetical protein